MQEINASEVFKKLENNQPIILLDVRTPEEYQRAHLSGSVLLPINNLSPDTLKQINLGEDKKTDEIIIYCLSGPRSYEACVMMQQMGYTNVKYIPNGLMGWRSQGYGFLE